MQGLEFNKTWSERSINPIGHFFENYFQWKGANRGYKYLVTNFDGNGDITTNFVYINGFLVNNNNTKYYGNFQMKVFVASAEALDTLDDLNNAAFNSTTDMLSSEYQQFIHDSYNGNGTKDAKWSELFDSLLWDSEMKLYSEATYGISEGETFHGFQEFIRKNIPNKENAVWQEIMLDYDNFELNNNIIENKLNVKYKKPIKLKEHIDMAEFKANGNTDLYLVFPYKNSDGRGFTTTYNKETGFSPAQFSYLALKITDMDGDGDIKFDHTDKIDYIDSVEFTLNTPNII